MASRKQSAPTTTAERERYWLQHLQAAKAQGATLAAYAEAEQINVRKLYDWKRVLGERGLLKRSSTRKRKSDFVTVASPASPILTEDTAPRAASLTVKLASNAELRFYDRLDPEQLTALLHALRRER